MHEFPARSPESADYYTLSKEFFKVVLSELEVIPDADACDD